MAISQRYKPSHPAGQSAVYAVDFSSILPPGTGLSMPSIQILTNTTPPGLATGITPSSGGFRGRLAWMTITGGVSGQDYIIQWTLIDSQSNTWIVSVLLMCAATS